MVANAASQPSATVAAPSVPRITVGIAPTAVAKSLRSTVPSPKASQIDLPAGHTAPVDLNNIESTEGAAFNLFSIAAIASCKLKSSWSKYPALVNVSLSASDVAPSVPTLV